MTTTVLFSILTSVLIYLVIAVLLIVLPVKRVSNNESLDFSALNTTTNGIQQEQYFTASDGSDLAYRHYAGSSDLVVILLHGSGSEGRYLTTLAQFINNNTQASVVVPDLRGHGLSQLASPGDVSYLGQFEQDLADLNNSLLTLKPNAKLILAGHSSGGGLAVRYAGGKQTPYSGYLLLAPYLGYNAPTVRPDSGGWVQVSTRRYAGLTMLNTFGITLLNKTAVLFFNRPAEYNDQWQVDAYSYRLNQSFAPRDYKTDVAKLQQPTLVLVGTDDEAFFAEKFNGVFAQFTPHAEVNLIKNAQHLNITDDANALQIILKWLQQF